MMKHVNIWLDLIWNREKRWYRKHMLQDATIHWWFKNQSSSDMYERKFWKDSPYRIEHEQHFLQKYPTGTQIVWEEDALLKIFIGAKFHFWANLPRIIRSNRRYQYSNFLGRTKMPTELTTNLDISEPSSFWSLDFCAFCKLLRDLIWELPRTPIRLHRSRPLFG